uniref:Uncharacterized protein n=1 Tax=Rhipicephalus zambeziensis TaxID=60191 RepID=A0A224Z1N3_9ACAR
MADSSRKAKPRTCRNPAPASLSAGDVSDDTTGTAVTPVNLGENPKIQRIERLVKEYLEIQEKIVRLETRQRLAHLRPSHVEKAINDMTAAARALHAAAKEAQSQQSEGSGIVVSSYEFAKECAALTSLLVDLSNSAYLQKKLDEGLTWTGFRLENLQKMGELLHKVADSIDTDVEQLRQRIERLKRD